MHKGKTVLTTGEVAKICNVAPRTVSKWFDSGQLKGYRIPGSKDRRIHVRDLHNFMRANNMPQTALLTAGKMRLLIVDNNTDHASSMADSLRAKTGYDVQIVCTDFEAGMAVQKFAPHVILINLMAKNIDASQICSNIRKDEELRVSKIIAVANPLNQSEVSALLQKGFDCYLPNSAGIDQIIEQVEKTTAIIY